MTQLNRRQWLGGAALAGIGALLTGVSGLDANRHALRITSSKISNVQTVGYKTSGANFSIDWSPETATPIGTRCSGRSQTLAESTRKWSPT